MGGLRKFCASEGIEIGDHKNAGGKGLGIWMFQKKL